MAGNCVSRSKESAGHSLLSAFGDIKFKDLFSAELNEPFDKIFEILKELERDRQALVEIPLKLIRETEVRILKEPRLIDALKVFAWSVSACNHGSLEKSGLVFYDRPPYFSVDPKTLSEEVQSLYNLLKTYFDALISAPSRIPGLENSIKDLVKKAKEQYRAVKDNVSDFDLNTLQKIQYVTNYTYNMDLVEKELRLLHSLLDKAEKDEQNFKHVVFPKIRVEVLVANVYGSQAYEEDIRSPKEIFLRFHTGTKKQPMPIKILENIDKTTAEIN